MIITSGDIDRGDENSAPAKNVYKFQESWTINHDWLKLHCESNVIYFISCKQFDKLQKPNSFEMGHLVSGSNIWRHVNSRICTKKIN